MSGLDPIGRKEIRDLILQLREEGRTVLFSTHILSDVEAICDRVGILVDGRLTDCGALADLVAPDVRAVELVVENAAPDLLGRLQREGTRMLQRDRTTVPRLLREYRRGRVLILGTGDNPLSAVYAGVVAYAAILAAHDPSSRGEASLIA